MDQNSVPPSNPYAAPQARVSDVAASEGELASRWLRLGGAIVDGLILMVVLVPVYLLLFWPLVSAGQQPGMMASAGFSVLGFVGFLAVQGYFLNQSGQTIAKKLLKMRIVDESGNKPEFAKLVGMRYAVLWVVSLVPFIGSLVGLVNVLFIFRDDRRCLHDLLAGTRVVMAE